MEKNPIDPASELTVGEHFCSLFHDPRNVYFSEVLEAAHEAFSNPDLDVKSRGLIVDFFRSLKNNEYYGSSLTTEEAIAAKRIIGVIDEVISLGSNPQFTKSLLATLNMALVQEGREMIPSKTEYRVASTEGAVGRVVGFEEGVAKPELYLPALREELLRYSSRYRVNVGTVLSAVAQGLQRELPEDFYMILENYDSRILDDDERDSIETALGEEINVTAFEQILNIMRSVSERNSAALETSRQEGVDWKNRRDDFLELAGGKLAA